MKGFVGVTDHDWSGDALRRRAQGVRKLKADSSKQPIVIGQTRIMNCHMNTLFGNTPCPASLKALR